MKNYCLIILGCLLLFSFEAQTQERTMSKRKAAKWFQKREWAGSFRLEPHGSIDETSFAYQYRAHRKLWDTAFAFLSTHDLSKLEKGDYPLAGDRVVVKVSYGPPKSEAEAKWEAHRKFIDVQIVGAGKEKIGVSALSRATVITEYDAKNDIAFYSTDGRFYQAAPGTFFIFFPQDVHRPGIKVEDGLVRKIVVKILVAE